MKRLTPSPSFHFITQLRGMSENNRYPPFFTQTGPSDHSKPAPSTSILASLGSSLSSLGSLRITRPREGKFRVSCAAAMHARQNKHTQIRLSIDFKSNSKSSPGG